MKSSTKALIVLLMMLLGSLVIYDLIKPSFKGPDLIQDPVQEVITPQVVAYVDQEGRTVEISLIAKYQVEGGILGVKNYSTDGASSVSPKDVVLGWGSLNQSTIKEEVTYRQSNRWYYYQYTSESLVSGDYIASHSANTHLIPSDEVTRKAINRLKVEDYVYLEGYLANVHFEHGNWITSTTREDRGDGACEIFYVTKVVIY